MAQGLLLDGVPVRVRRGTWIEGERITQGGRLRMRAGNLISTEDPATEKRQADCEVYFLSYAEEAAFRSAYPKGTEVTVSGELPGDYFAALVDVGPSEERFVYQPGVAAIHRVVRLHLEGT